MLSPSSASPASSASLPLIPSHLPALGVGLGFREPFRSDLFLHPEAADFLEITADHYFDPTPEKAAELDLLAEHFTLIPHGLNLSLGSADGLDDAYLENFARLIERLDPPWWSEHIAFTRAGGVEIGHLTPLPFTREAVEAFAANVAHVRRRIATPLIIENITFSVHLPGAEMTEAGFVSAVLAATGCGLLLDVTNLHTNCVNHRTDPHAALDQLPLDRVVQLHFTGGHVHRGELIDSHSQPTPPAIWDLLEHVLHRAPVRGVILERDENLPPFAELAAELTRARDLGRRHHRWA
ncbi:hypothetical protein LBMAG56_45610 [Verrucomicrobiota bacterium]|nr:hypothetical protein LBMAG56_45610 [Verrucomicrobiota bacterium]